MRAPSPVAASPDEMKKPLQRGSEVMKSVPYTFRILSSYFYLKQSTCVMQGEKPHSGNTYPINELISTHLSVIVRENRAGPKDRGRPFNFIFSQYKSYSKRLTTMIFAEVGVRFSSRYHHIMILTSQAV